VRGRACISRHTQSGARQEASASNRPQDAAPGRAVGRWQRAPWHEGPGYWPGEWPWQLWPRPARPKSRRRRWCCGKLGSHAERPRAGLRGTSL